MTAPIVILGASFSGLPMAHKLLKNLPSSEIVLVSPSHHLYWNIGSPRAITSAEFAKSLHQDFLPGFSAYPSPRFTFVQGLATSVDPTAKTVHVKKVSDEQPEGDGETELTYSHLIIATGARDASDGVWKSTSPVTVLRASIDALRVKIEAADHVVVSGGGATGVETAGEIATSFPNKKVTLIVAKDRPLDDVQEDVGHTAIKLLKSLKVEVIVNTKVVENEDTKDVTSITLSDGKKLENVLHIPTHGVVPNTSFLPSDWLDETGSLKVDANLHAHGQTDIWAVGDVIAGASKKAVTIIEQFAVVFENVVAAVKGESTLKEYVFNPKAFKVSALAVPIGKKFAYGVGVIMGWKMWGFLVWLVKGRTYMVENLADMALGKTTVGQGKV